MGVGVGVLCVGCWMSSVYYYLVHTVVPVPFFIAKNQVCGTSRNGFFLCFHTYNIFYMYFKDFGFNRSKL